MKMARVIAIAILTVSLSVVCFAAEKRTAQIASIDGSAQVKLAGQTGWSPASIGMVLNEGDTVKTAAKSLVILDLAGKGQAATVEVKESSQLLMAELMVEPAAGTSKTMLDLAMGEVLIKAQKLQNAESKFEVKTPTSIVGVRGTTFSVKVEAVEE